MGSLYLHDLNDRNKSLEIGPYMIGSMIFTKLVVERLVYKKESHPMVF